MPQKKNQNQQLSNQIAQLQASVNKLEKGKLTAKPKRKPVRGGPTNNALISMGVMANEFATKYRAPTITSAGDGMSRISGREIIKSLSVTFTNGVSVETPFVRHMRFYDGQPYSTFKWLQDYANLYDLYKFLKLRFYFQPALATCYSGNIAMYFDPGIMEDPSLTFEQISNNYGAVTSSVHQPISMTVTKDTLSRLNWYEVSGGQATDNAISSVGSLMITLSALSAITTISGEVVAGYVWAEYEAVFKNPTDPAH